MTEEQYEEILRRIDQAKTVASNKGHFLIIALLLLLLLKVYGG